MFIRNSLRIFTAAVVSLAFITSTAWARCGGLCLYEVGIPDQGASGAGQSARANDASTSYTNPAGMTRLDRHQAMLGASVIYYDPQIDLNLDSTTTATPGEDNNGGHIGGFVPLGGLHIVTSITEDLKFGFTAGGSVGGSVEFDDQWIGRQYVTESEIAVLDMIPTAAYKITDQISIGVGVPIGYGKLDYDLRATAGENSPTVQLEDGDDWEVGAIVGLLFEFNEDSRIGVVYQAEREFELSGTVRNPTQREISFDAGFLIPQGINVALYHKIMPSLAVLLDAGWTDWSEFDYQGLRAGPIDGAIPRRFRDTWRIGAGLEYDDADTPWLVRGGISYDSSPIRDSARLPDVPADETWRFSLGGEYDITETVRLGTSYTLFYAGDQEFDQVPVTPDGSVVLDGDTENTFGSSLGVTLNWIFG